MPSKSFAMAHIYMRGINIMMAFEEIIFVDDISNIFFNSYGCLDACVPEQPAWTRDNSGLNELAIAGSVPARVIKRIDL